MPLPLKPGENIYIDHKIKEASYAMPAMQAAHDHYTIGYMVSGDRRWIATDNIRYATLAILGLPSLRFITGTVLYRMFLMTDM